MDDHSPALTNPAGTGLTDIRSVSSDSVRSFIESVGQPKYRADQLLQWIWQKGATSFDQMLNLPISLRTVLKKYYTFLESTVDLKQKSSDGTIKLRIKLYDGHHIETVLIPVPADRRYTVCVSSQVGCSLSCTFCATGRMGLRRQLTAAEIIDQVRLMKNICMEEYDHHITNVVYMGMGEPLLNYRQVSESIYRLTDQQFGLGMSPRRITISTAGIAKMIKRMADDGLKVNLALSLHAPTDAQRDPIMAINETNDLKSLLDALQYFYDKTRNRISYEYIALKGVNDSDMDARHLVSLCRRYPVRVNVIEYNPIGDGIYEASSEDNLEKFMKILSTAGVMATLRRSRGHDIDAACGQLANK